LGHTTTVRVRFGDTDPYGVVYFAAYFRYFKEALDEFLRSLGLAPDRVYRDAERGLGLPIVESWARFEAPARYDDLLLVSTRVEERREKAGGFAFEAHRHSDGALIASGRIVCVAIDEAWRPVAIPEDLAEKLSGRTG